MSLNGWTGFSRGLPYQNESCNGAAVVELMAMMVRVVVVG